MLDTFMLIVLIGATLVLGFIGSHIFSKTKIPDVIWLLIFGLLIAYFGIVPREPFIAMSSILASIALFIVLFDAGLNMDFYKFIHGFSRSFVLALIGFVFSMAVVAFLGIWFLELELLQALLLGAILGGTCSTTVIVMTSGIRDRENTRTLLSLEAVLTDPITIVVSMALIGLIVPTAFVNAYSPLHGIMSAFSIGIVSGLLIGFVWMFVLYKIRGKGFDYMLTLGLLFLMYAGVEYTGGSGAVAALFFGLILGNGRTFSKMLKLKKDYSISSYLIKFQTEITFFIRSFFFVFLGVIVVINQTYLIYGILIATALVVVRLIAAQLAMIRLEATSMEKNIIRTMAPRGLAAAILAQLAIVYNVPGADVFTSIIFIVIFATAIYSAICVAVFSRSHGKNKDEDDEKVKKKRL